MTSLKLEKCTTRCSIFKWKFLVTCQRLLLKSSYFSLIPGLWCPFKVFSYKKGQKQPPEAFYKKAISKNFTKFTGKHLCWSYVLIKLQTFQTSNFVNKRHQHRCFPANIANFLRTPILKIICERFLLKRCNARTEMLHTEMEVISYFIKVSLRKTFFQIKTLAQYLWFRGNLESLWH